VIRGSGCAVAFGDYKGSLVPRRRNFASPKRPSHVSRVRCSLGRSDIADGPIFLFRSIGKQRLATTRISDVPTSRITKFRCRSWWDARASLRASAAERRTVSRGTWNRQPRRAINHWA
jgi:hypothetical protein